MPLSSARSRPIALAFVRGVGFPHLSRDLVPIPRNKKDPNGYYLILGLHPWATEIEIRRAYHKLARRFHPDGEEPNVAMFERITEVYEVLTSPTQRQAYHDTPDNATFVDNHIRRIFDGLGLQLPLEEDVEVDDAPALDYDFYRIGFHKDDREDARRWYGAVVEDFGKLGYRQVIHVCLTDGQMGYDARARILFVPRTTEQNFSEHRAKLVSRLS